MEKITKNELLEQLGGTALSDDELEKVPGGFDERCLSAGNEAWQMCINAGGNEEACRKIKLRKQVACINNS